MVVKDGEDVLGSNGAICTLLPWRRVKTSGPPEIRRIPFQEGAAAREKGHAFHKEEDSTPGRQYSLWWE